MKIRNNNNLPHFFLDLEEYCPEEVARISEDIGENAVIYGMPCFRIEKGYAYEGYIFLSDSPSDYIGFANKYNDNIEKLSIKNIFQITFNKDSDNLKGYQKTYPDETFFQILIGQKFYDFSMFTKYQLLLIIKGILSIFKKKEIKYDKSMDGQLIQMVNKYDTNFNKEFDSEEFQHFSKMLGIPPKLLMIDIDVNHDGVVSQDEIIKYLQSKTSGYQLTQIFNQYATREKDSPIFLMTPLNLQKFFHELQEEPISELESYLLIISYKIGIDNQIKRKISKKIQNSYIANQYKINEEEIKNIFEKVKNKYKIDQQIKLQLSLREFYSMLNSYRLSVYRSDKMMKRVDLDKPLTDYFINSSHNTYITGNQLSSYSSSKMYSLSLLEGYRLVELDCYNGHGEDITITHGYTLVSKLKLDDILYELKKSAFVKSPMPVILSIENHLDEVHQNIMARKFKEILKDLYIFPFDKKPDYLPTLREMQNKFRIKCGGKRLWEKDEIKRATNEEKNLLRERHNIKLKKYILFDNFKDLIDSDDEEELKKEKEKKEKEEKEKEAKENEIEKEEEGQDLEILLKNELNINKTQEIKSNCEQIKQAYSEEINMKNSKKEDDEVNETETIPYLEKLRGLPGTKFKFDKIAEKNYKPWECLTLKCKKFLKYHSNPLKQNEIIKLSQHCILKAYPDSFTSANYDIIKCWRCGCQAAAVNIQALEDDFTLFNTVFFLQNRKCGYVLKPSKLLDPKIIIDYERALYTLKMKIISCYNLIKLMDLNENILYEKGKLQMEIYSLGSDNDDKNPHKKYELKGGLMFPNIVGNDLSFDIPIYEDELGGIMIKITYNGKLIGRGCVPYCLMKNGIRRVPIYDNDCYICDGAFVLGYFQKKKRDL